MLVEDRGCNVHQFDFNIEFESWILGIRWRSLRLRILLWRILLRVRGNGYNSGTQNAKKTNTEDPNVFSCVHRELTLQRPVAASLILYQCQDCGHILYPCSVKN
ncbi:MAG: hypothetical protein DMG15_13465 [Acidobacteria bacterium]|nr:MAG: hypothetical protein DMG15_13465 [Acidobacteriota bacterium]